MIDDKNITYLFKYENGELLKKTDDYEIIDMWTGVILGKSN